MVGDKGQILSRSDYGTSFDLKLKDEKTFSSGLTHPAVRDIPQTIPRNAFSGGGGAGGCG